MSCEMHALLPVSFYGYDEHYDTLYKIEEAIDENKKGREEAIAGLYKLAYMTEPTKFVPAGEDTTVEMWIDERVQAIIHDLEVAAVDNYKLELLKENWKNCHMKVGGEERAVTIPKDMNDKKPIYDWAFLEGDYTNSVYPDGTDEYPEDK